MDLVATVSASLAQELGDVGAAGHPPKDQSRGFVIYAVILLVVAWIVVPVAITVAVSTT